MYLAYIVYTCTQGATVFGKYQFVLIDNSCISGISQILLCPFWYIFGCVQQVSRLACLPMGSEHLLCTHIWSIYTWKDNNMRWWQHICRSKTTTSRASNHHPKHYRTHIGVRRKKLMIKSNCHALSSVYTHRTFFLHIPMKGENVMCWHLSNKRFSVLYVCALENFKISIVSFYHHIDCLFYFLVYHAGFITHKLAC